MSRTIYIGRPDLTVKDFLKAARGPRHVQLQLDREAAEKMDVSRSVVEKICSEKTPVYGINTGFGPLSNQFIEEGDLEKLQTNIIRSHCVGVGAPLSKRETRLLMLLRAHTLALGFSGVRPVVVQTIISFLNQDVLPIIPEEGSVGASGDLAPLAHMSLALMGEGIVKYQGQKLKASVALKQAKIEPLQLMAKEGLALINGTQQMLTYGILCLAQISKLLKVADVVAACSLEGIRGSLKPFDGRVHEVRHHPGQKVVSDNIRRLLSHSEILVSHKDCNRVQDSYSFRCVPQVHGASRDYASSAATIMLRELHAVTDNPIVFPDTQEVISGGNFHGAPLAIGLDLLAIAVSEIGAISERRIDKLTNPVFSELPTFLTQNPGLNSGVMIAQYTAAALASENKILCHPSSVDSIPTSNDKEDHVSMGPAAGRKLKKIILNVERILALEALCARHALFHLEPLKPGRGVLAAYQKMAQVIPPLENDRVLAGDAEKMHGLLFKENFLQSVQNVIGVMN